MKKIFSTFLFFVFLFSSYNTYGFIGNKFSEKSSLTQLDPLTLIPQKPVLKSSNCISSNFSTSYLDSTSFIWNIFPAEAGSVVNGNFNGPNVTINWNPAFTGIANIYVKLIGYLYSYSESYSVDRSNQPAQQTNSLSYASSNVCPGSLIKLYTSLDNATEYQWNLEPSYAGVILPGDSITGCKILYSTSFTGNTTITVRAYNACSNIYSNYSPGLNIMVNNTPPPQPVMPVNISKVFQNCSNKKDTIMINDVATATSYTWNLTPLAAGTIIGTGTNGIVNWTNGYLGQASISVTANSVCGSGLSSPFLNINVNNNPVKPLLPTGSVSICKSDVTNLYSTSASNATSYYWHLTNSAGQFYTQNNNATVTWNSTYIGDAYLKVAGQNSCGTGIYSDSLKISINGIPTKAATPSGLINFSQNPVNTNYTTTNINGTSQYEWIITPESSAIITGTSSTANVNFNDIYLGSSSLKVRGVNNCGSGAFSEPLIINVQALKPDMPAGPSSVCSNIGTSEYNVINTQNVKSCIWSLTPAAAGTISGNSFKGTVTWLPGYKGNAAISVTENYNTDISVSSDLFNVSVNSFPLKSDLLITGPSIVCSGAISKFSTVAENENTYTWFLIPSNVGVISGNKEKVMIKWDAGMIGPANLKVIASNSCGSTESDIKSLSINSRPAIPNKPVMAGSYCPNTKITLSATSNNNDEIRWFSNSGENLFSGLNYEVPSLKYGSVFKIVAINTSGCTSDTVIVTPKIQELKADFNADLTTIKPGESIHFINNSLNAISYSWYINNTYFSSTAEIIRAFKTIGDFDIALEVTNSAGCKDKLEKVSYIHVTDLTSIENEKTLGFKIYPNPTSDYIYIEGNEYLDGNKTELCIFSILGNELIKKNIISGIINKIDLSALPAGEYIGRINLNGLFIYKKIIKTY